MIYLLRASGINEKHKPVLILKIGYTDDSRKEYRDDDQYPYTFAIYA